MFFVFFFFWFGFVFLNEVSRGLQLAPIVITPRAHARARGYVIGRGVYTLNCRSVVREEGRQFHACALNPIDFEWQ